MKLIFSTALLFTSLLSNNSPVKPPCKLTIVAGDCRLQSDLFMGNMHVSIYTSLGDSLIKASDCNIRRPRFECDLPPGRYKIRYNNNYSQTITKGIDLDSGSRILSLCADSLNAYPRNVLPKLKERQQLLISYTSSGCFHHTVMRLMIKRESAKLVATLFDDNAYDPEKRQPMPKNLLRGRKELTAMDISAFNRFENEIALVGDGLCTTTDTYSVKSDYWKVEKRDGTCGWNGFTYLTNAWFGK